MPNTAPIPNYPSQRLIGIELEVDAGSTKLNLPSSHPGWSKKSDGSLRNGFEFVLEPALPLSDASDVVKNFLDALDKARANTSKRGGLHVHVGVSDYDSNNNDGHNDAYSLVKLYSRYQSVIDSLVGKSRVGNSYCPPYRQGITKREVIDLFMLNHSASSRNDARTSRAYSVVNLAMLRCRSSELRSVEFRQGSPSKRFECVWGWTTLMVCLVDMARCPVVMTHELIEAPATLENFIALIKFHEERVGSTNVGNWVQWRYDYMNEQPTDEQVLKAVSLMGRNPRGLFHVSRVMEINLALAGRIMDVAEQRQLVTAVRTSFGEAKKYQSKYRNWAGVDLTALEEAALVRSRTTPPPSAINVPMPPVSTAATLTVQEQRDVVALNQQLADIADDLERRENQV